MKPVVRFAPSPTGYLHMGNARSALLNWLYAKRRGGTFVLRLDDTDTRRSTAHFADAIVADLAWLGVSPDSCVRQSDRIALYDQAAQTLRDKGLLYACYETPDELQRRRKRRLARGLPPVYDRAALALSAAEKRRFEAQGRQPHWRFRLSGESVRWTDLVRGEQTIDGASLSDPILIRADGTYLYTLPSVVDDMDLRITHIIRGEDHVTNSAVQIEIFAALDGAPPRFAHNNLLTSPGGEGLSKRQGAQSLRALRQAQMEPAAVASMASLLGSGQALAPYQTLDALAEVMDLGKLSRAPAQFDPATLAALSARTLHEMPFAIALERLKSIDLDVSEAFWLAVRGNLMHLEDARMWFEVVYGDIASDGGGGSAEFFRQAMELLPPEPWDDTVWKTWTAALRQISQKRGRALFLPLRLALTARAQGPDLAALLPLIGYTRAHARLSRACRTGEQG